MKKYRILSIFLLIFVLFSGSIHLNSVTVNIPWHAVYAQYNSYLFFGGISWGKGVVADGTCYVYTTGSTVDECARELKKHGALKVDVLTLARTR